MSKGIIRRLSRDETALTILSTCYPETYQLFLLCQEKNLGIEDGEKEWKTELHHDILIEEFEDGDVASLEQFYGTFDQETRAIAKNICGTA